MISCKKVTRYTRTSYAVPAADNLGAQLRRLREQTGSPQWKAGAAADMDSALLSRIETGKHPVRADQLVKLAAFLRVSLEPLETQRLAEEMARLYGSHPGFAAAAAIVRENAGEYRVNKSPDAGSKRSATGSKSASSVSNRKKSR